MVTKCPRGIRLFFSYTVAWYTNHDACCSFLCGNFCASLRARAWDDLPTMSRHTTSKAPREKPAFFPTGGRVFFMVSVSLRISFFLCPVLCGCVGVEGAFPCGGIPSWNRKEKRLPRPLPARGAHLGTEAEPGYFPPQTLRLSAGRSNHLWLFRWKNLPGISRPSA